MLSELLSTYSTTLDPWKLVLHLFLAALLGYAVSMIYTLTNVNPDRKLARLFPLLAATMTLASSLIASSLGIAIGLVGALSIIRFRTIVNDIEQMAFLFLAIGAGLAASTGYFFTGALTIAAIGFLLFLQNTARERQGESLRISIQGEGPQVGIFLEKLLQDHPHLQFESLAAGSEGLQWELSGRISKPSEVFALRERLSEAPGLTFSLITDDAAQ